MARRPERALALALAVAALAAAGCGSTPSYRERAQDACATASPRTAADPARTAADARAGLAKLRRTDLPKDGAQHLTAQRLVANLGDQQRTLDRLAAGLRTHASAATLRDLAQRVTEQGTLVQTPARQLGAPACGAAATAVAARLHAQDYAAAVHRTAGQLTLVHQRLPHIGGPDRVRQIYDAARASDAFDDLAARLEPLEPPRGATAQHGRLLYDLYALRDGYARVGDRHGPRLASALAARRKDYNKAQADWRALAARLPRVPATGSPWGPTDGAAQAARAERKEYIKTVNDELFGVSVDLPRKGAPTRAKLRTIARVSAHAHSRLIDLRAPADAARAHRLMLSGLTDLQQAATLDLHLHSLAAAKRAVHLAERSIDRFRRAQRRFHAAGYRFDLVGRDGSGGSRSSAPPNSQLS